MCCSLFDRLAQAVSLSLRHRFGGHEFQHQHGNTATSTARELGRLASCSYRAVKRTRYHGLRFCPLPCYGDVTRSCKVRLYRTTNSLPPMATASIETLLKLNNTQRPSPKIGDSFVNRVHYSINARWAAKSSTSNRTDYLYAAGCPSKPASRYLQRPGAANHWGSSLRLCICSSICAPLQRSAPIPSLLREKVVRSPQTTKDRLT